MLFMGVLGISSKEILAVVDLAFELLVVSDAVPKYLPMIEQHSSVPLWLLEVVD
jgi:hypothetical protein